MASLSLPVTGLLALVLVTGCSSPPGAVPDPGKPATPSSGPAAARAAAAMAALPDPLRVVGVGDSVTAAAHCDCSGFVADYGVLLERRFDLTVDAVEYGVSGATTASMLPELSGAGTTARAVARADVISVTIGANDLEPARTAYDAGTCGGARDLGCFTAAVARMKAGLARDLAAIDRLTAGRKVDVLVNNYWNVFEDGQVALDEDGQRYLDDSDTMTRMANAAICTAATAAGATCVDTYTPYKGADGGKDPTELLAPDGDHPDAAGHLVIAQAMLRAGLADLRS